jgi:RNA polymerase sigma-70 factor (ECF subfamily)
MELGVDYSQHADEMLLDMIARRDADALTALYDRHAQTIYNMINRIIREPAVAAEVHQDTFWQVWQKAGEFHGAGAAAAWVYRIARNKSLDQLRRQKARPQVVATTLVEDEPGVLPPPADTASVEQISEQAWKRQRVRRALGDIPIEQRLCLELAYYEGMSQREIAERVNISLGTVKTRIRLGLEKLERILRADGLTAEDAAL